jgi:hypothetical protein
LRNRELRNLTADPAAITLPVVIQENPQWRAGALAGRAIGHGRVRDSPVGKRVAPRQARV